MDNSTNHTDDILVRYLDGELNDAEKKSVDEQLSASASLQGQWESLLSTREAIRLYGLQQQVATIHQEMMPELQTPVRTMQPRRRMLRAIVAVAASIVLIAGGILAYNFYTLSASKVFSSNYHSYELTTMRSGNGQELTPVETAYRAGDFKKVTEMVNAGDVSLKDEFLTAMAWSELNNSGKAVDGLKRVLSDNERLHDASFHQEAEYYLALNYVRTKDFDLALELFRKIKDDPNHLYHKKVSSKLIRQLKMLKWR